jgi:branched-chain amino acid transport system ATP-binding protein
MNKCAPLLEVSGLDAGYGDIKVLWNLSLAVTEGQIVAIVGSNGAGKTTLLRTISGILAPQRGEIHLAGERLDGCTPHAVVRRGVIQVPEGRKLFAEMTLEDNLLMGAYHRRDRQIAEDLRHVYDLFPRLRERRWQKAGSLSGGEQQMAAIGRGLMGRPRLFLIDEMSLGLAPLIVDDLVEIVTSINGRGTTVLLVEQDVQLALENSNYAYVLETGRVVREGLSNELLKDPVFKNVYLGV